MRQPGFVEVQRVDPAVEHLLDGFDVVQNAVVGALREGQYAWRTPLASRERIRVDLLLDVFKLEGFVFNRPDDSVMIARGHQDHRYRRSHHDRVEHGLVAVPLHLAFPTGTPASFPGVA